MLLGATSAWYLWEERVSARETRENEKFVNLHGNETRSSSDTQSSEHSADDERTEVVPSSLKGDSDEEKTEEGNDSETTTEDISSWESEEGTAEGTSREN